MSRVSNFTFYLYLLSIIQLFSQTAEEHFLRAKEVFPNHEKSINFLNKAISLSPDDVKFHFAKAKVEFLFGKVAKEKVLESFNLALKLDPENVHIKCWLVFTGFHFSEIKKYSPLLLDILEAGKINNKFLFYFVHFMTSKYKNVKFKNDNEIYQKLLKAPKNFDRQMALYSYYLSKKYHKEATKELYNVEYLSGKQVLSSTAIYDIFSNESLPYVLNKIAFNEFDIILQEPNKSSLSARLAHILNYKNQFKYLSTLSGYRVTSQNFHNEGNPLKSFLILGKYKDTLFFSNKAADPNRFKYVCEAYKRMGLYSEAAKFSSFLPKEHYTSKKLMNLVKKIEYLLLAEEYQKAEELIGNCKVSGLEQKYFQSFLYCKYYSMMNMPQDWRKHAKGIKKHRGSETLIEMMTQTNHIMKLTGGFSSEIFTQLSRDDIYKNPSIMDYLYSQADSCMAAGKFKDAIKWIVTAKKVSPEDIRDTYQQAKYFFKTGELDKAIYRIKQFLSDSPNDIKGLILEGMISLEKNNFADANKSFSKILNKNVSAYYLLVSEFCKTGPGLFSKYIKETQINTEDTRSKVLIHMFETAFDNESANKNLKEAEKLLKSLQGSSYLNYKLGTISFEKFKQKLDHGPVLSLTFNFTIGIEAMQRGEKEKAVEHFKKCLIPYSIDLAEYHMAKACLRELTK